MQVMVAEYASQMVPELAQEGTAIRDALCAGFRACGHVIHIPDPRAHNDVAFEREVQRLARICDAGIVVAPDPFLYELTALVEENTVNLGCPPGAIRQAVDKLMSSRLLRDSHVRVPDFNPQIGPFVLKPRCGCGSEGVRVVRQLDSDDFTEDTLISKFIAGEHISVSLMIGQAVLPLAINKQLVQIGEHVRYHGNMTPYQVPEPDEVLFHATKAAQVLSCQGYVGVDMVLGSDGASTVIEVNARPTTAIVSINRVIGNVAELMLNARFRNELPDVLTPRGKHTFLKRNSVKP